MVFVWFFTAAATPLHEGSHVSPLPPLPLPPPPPCVGWCALNAHTWSAKCHWPACTGCSVCYLSTAPPPPISPQPQPPPPTPPPPPTSASCNGRGYLNDDGHCTCTTGPATGLVLSFCHKMYHEHPQYDAHCCVRAGSAGALAASANAAAEKQHVNLQIDRATDYAWVEVSRHRDSTATEGMGYGCWFAHTPGSGLWINLGRTRVFREKNDEDGKPHSGLSRWVATEHFCGHAGPCVHDQASNPAGSWPGYAGREKLCTAAGCPCDFCDPIFDAWWAVRASSRGWTLRPPPPSPSHVSLTLPSPSRLPLSPSHVSLTLTPSTAGTRSPRGLGLVCPSPCGCLGVQRWA
jgi:hypothetical protein